MRLLCALFAVVFFLTGLAPAARAYAPINTSVEDLKLIDSGIVKAVLKPDLIQLENGKIYHLDGLRIPTTFRAQVKALVEELTLGKPVRLLANPTLSVAGTADRSGANFVHAVTTDGVWLQEKIISSGFAWAYGTENNRDFMRLLQKVELSAHKNQQGLWVREESLISNAELAKKQIDSFQIIEGKAYGTSCTYTACYVNFESDYKKDLTILIPDRTLRNFKAYFPYIKNITLLAKSPIRIRGWIEQNNGPMIRLEFPEQIQFVADLN